MKHLSLFSGIGGFDLAAQWMGWENMAHCEINPFCRTILNYYWPNAKSYEDIKTTDFSVWRGIIDIVTGGFPCQPFSQAGARKGTDDDRHLWPEMLRAIREIQPSYIVGENVYGIFNWNEGMVFEQVQIDLEAEGYEVQPVIIPACAVGAPHRRDRVWFVAHAISNEYIGKVAASNAETNGLQEVNRTQHSAAREFSGANNDNDKKQFIADAGLLRQAESGKQTTRIKQCNKINVADADDTRLQGGAESRNIARSGARRNEQFTGFFRPNWQNFPTQSPICNGNDGISTKLDGITFSKWRNESIKAAGNAIVPQVAYQIFKAIEATI